MVEAMRLYFRPFPILTIVCVAAVAALVWLGVWQLQRAEWKRGLIADFERQAELPSVSWEEGVCPFLEGASDTEIRPMEAAEIDRRVSSAAMPADGFRVFGRSVAGAVGWRRFQALQAASCGSGAGWVLVQTGFDPEAIGGMAPAPPVSNLHYAIAPWPQHPIMAGANAPENNQWYWLDADTMAAATVGGALNRDYVVLPFAGTPAFLTRTPPIRHISYAVTWFGLAIALLFVYVLLHTRAGRLSATRRDKPSA